MKKYLSLYLYCCFALMLASCSAKPEATDGAKLKVVEPVTCIAILPSQMGVDEEIAKAGGFYENVQKGTDYSDSVLRQKLGSNQNVKFVSHSDLNREVSGNLQVTVEEVSKITGCDTVMVPTILRFKQRLGTTYAADEPASTSFNLRLYNAGTMRVLWATDFSETQQTLFSNLFLFGKAKSRGFQWITVEDLFSQGLNERLAECPYL